MKTIDLPADWWKDSVVYQIYTRSFLDSNGDGIGDFGGVTAKLDYLKELGVDVIWLSPFCESPNDDNGYDISDYRRIHPEFGTMTDFVKMTDAAHRRGIKVMMDLVMNHTSDEHPWFVESRSSIDNPKRDWYIWREPKSDADGNRVPPNNWDSYFGGSAWQYDDTTGQYYLHIFSTKQPDLNWANPEVREEMARIAEFWIQHGVNAFRLDAVHHIGKPKGLPDFIPPKARQDWMFKLYKNTPETHIYLQELHKRVFAPHNVFTVGETGGTTPKSSQLYVNSKRQELNIIHHFEQLFLPNPSDAADIKRNLKRWYSSLSRSGWDAQFLSNHDLPRQVSSYGNDQELHGKSAKAIAAMILTAWGTPFIYQGEEIGMTNYPFKNLDEFRDRHGLSWYYAALARGVDPEYAWAGLLRSNRDNSRTPMQWSANDHAGFTSGTPWIAANPNCQQINVARQQSQPDSVLGFYRALLKLRQQQPVLRRGKFRLLPVGKKADAQVIAYVRSLPGEQSVVVLVNWTDYPAELALPRRIAGVSHRSYQTVLTNNTHSEAQQGLLNRSPSLLPYEVRICTS